MLMNEQADLLELLLSNKQQDFLRTDGDLSAFALPTERDQQLDMDNIIDPSDGSSLLFLNNLLGEGRSPQVVDQIVEVQSQPQPLIATEVPQFNEDLIFQFPPTTQEEFPETDITVEIVDDMTDTESLYSSTVPSTPFSPTSLPPPTPDTASSDSYSCGNIPSFNKLGSEKSIKSSLKMAIKSKREKEGKGDLKVEFLPPPPEQLTPEEEARRCEKREKNKLAAQKCREKKRARIDELEAETKKLRHRQNQYKLEVQKLIDERDKLMDIINIHSQVCPHMRAQASNI